MWATTDDQTEKETEEDLELGRSITKEPDPENVKFISKGDYRHVRATVKNIQECMSEEKNAQKQKPERDRFERPLVAASGPRRPGPWRFLEIVTWACAVTMLAHKCGCDTYEPVTMTRWVLDLVEVRSRRRATLTS